MKRIIFYIFCIPVFLVFVMLAIAAFPAMAIVEFTEWYDEKMCEFERWCWK